MRLLHKKPAAKREATKPTPVAAPSARRSHPLPAPTPRTHTCPCGGICPRCQRQRAARAAVQGTAANAGGPLPGDLRAQLESTAGRSLVHVRLHTDRESAAVAAAMAARAYTVGADIHFARGAYDPGSRAGQDLIAHEAAHALQQPTRPARKPRIELSRPTEPAERDADRFADAFARGERFALPASAAPTGVLRVYRRDDASPRHLPGASPDRLRCRRQPHPDNPCAGAESEDLRAIVRLSYAALPGDIGSAIVHILETPATRGNAAHRVELLKTACCMLDPALARTVRDTFEHRRGHVGERFGRLATAHRCAILDILDHRAAAPAPTPAPATAPGTRLVSARDPAIRALSSARVQRARAALDRELFRVAGKPDLISFFLPEHTRYARRRSAQFIHNDLERFYARINQRSTFAIAKFGATGVVPAIEPAAYLVANALRFFACMFDQLDGTTSDALENLIKSSPLRLLRVPDRLAAGVLVGMKNAIAGALATLKTLVTDPWSLIQPTIDLIREMSGPGGDAIACALGGDMGEHLATIVHQASRRGLDALAYRLGEIAGPSVLRALLSVLLPSVGTAIAGSRIFKRLIALLRSIRHRLPFRRRHHHHDEVDLPEPRQLHSGEHEPAAPPHGEPHTEPPTQPPGKAPITIDLTAEEENRLKAARGVPTLSKVLPNLSKVDARVVSRAAELAKGGTSFADDLAALSRSTSEVVGSHAKVHLLGQHGGQAVFGSARSGIGIVASEQGTLLVRVPRGGAVEVLGLFR